MYSHIVPVPSFSPTSAQTVLTELVRRVGQADRAEVCAAEVAERHAAEIVLGDSPSTNESGRVLAGVERGAAVTTLKVEPGG